MEPEIIEEKTFKLLGCVYYGNPFHSAKGWDPNNEIGNTWKRFESLGKKYEEFLEKIKEGDAYGYEVHIEPADYDMKKKFHIFVGIEVRSLEFFPLEMFYKILPKTKYLFFTSKYMGKGADYYFNKWLPESNFEISFPYIMQSYSPSFPYIMQSYSPRRWKNENDPNSLMDWYIPIKEKVEVS
jgi:AraC family transcriptional regulator